jgi:hypothetical protein
MSQSWKQLAAGGTLSLLSLAGCTREILPTGAAPEAAPSPVALLPQVVSTPVLEPTPVPSASPAASSCPTLLGIRVTVFAAQPERNRVVLDATPLTEQCAAFPGRLVCPLGQPGTSRRDECEAVRIGEGGPLWTIAPYGNASVEALPGTGYLAEVFGRGLVTACSRVQPDVCADIEIR